MPLLLLTAQLAVAQHEIKHLSIASTHASKQGNVPLERAACDQCFAFASLAGAMPVAAQRRAVRSAAATASAMQSIIFARVFIKK